MGIFVYLPRVPSGLPPAAVDGDDSLAIWRFRRAHLARSFKCARDLDTEVARCQRARRCRVVDTKILAVSPQARLTGNDRLPDSSRAC